MGWKYFVQLKLQFCVQNDEVCRKKLVWKSILSPFSPIHISFCICSLTFHYINRICWGLTQGRRSIGGRGAITLPAFLDNLLVFPQKCTKTRPITIHCPQDFEFSIHFPLDFESFRRAWADFRKCKQTADWQNYFLSGNWETSSS